MDRKTLYAADILDEHSSWNAAEPVFQDYGGRLDFHGRIATVKVYEDNVLVKQALAEPGEGRVLVVDGGGSKRCALCGGNVAELAHTNGWAGIVIFGCVRDQHEIAAIDIGLKALATHPRKSVKRGAGETQVAVTFAGVLFEPGQYLVADCDGIVVGPASDIRS
ncbi:MAG: ribonuclease E activity regulator RraA [Myxococcota bacterium]